MTQTHTQEKRILHVLRKAAVKGATTSYAALSHRTLPLHSAHRTACSLLLYY